MMRIKSRHLWSFVAFLLFGLFIFSVFIYYKTGRETDPDFTIFAAVKSVFSSFIGESEVAPKGKPGEIVRLVLIILSILIGVSTVIDRIDKITSVFERFQITTKFLISPEMEARMQFESVRKKMSGHIVICNWNQHGDRIVKEIQTVSLSRETPIVVIHETDINEKELRYNPAYEKVYFVRSDPTSHDVLVAARAHMAKSIIILADPECSDPDAKTGLISLAVKQLSRDRTQKPHILAELISHLRAPHLKFAGVDEWVCPTDYLGLLIAHSAIHRRMTDVYQELFSFSESANEIYVVSVDQYPKIFVGQSFAEVAKMVIDNGDSKNPALLLGIRRGDRSILNPKEAGRLWIQEGDELIVVAYSLPDFTQLQRKSF